MRLATLLLPLCLVACRSESEQPLEEFPPVYAYAGPPVHVELLDGSDGHVLACVVDPPTAGHRITFDHSKLDGGTLRVFATLRHPAPDAVLADAPIEQVELNVPLEGEFDAVELHVARWMEGVAYVHQPEYQQAARIEHVH